MRKVVHCLFFANGSIPYLAPIMSSSRVCSCVGNSNLNTFWWNSKRVSPRILCAHSKFLFLLQQIANYQFSRCQQKKNNVGILMIISVYNLVKWWKLLNIYSRSLRKYPAQSIFIFGWFFFLRCGNEIAKLTVKILILLGGNSAEIH